MHRCLDKYFQFTERGSSIFQEFRAGTTGFLATSNNFALNASILSAMGLDSEKVVVSSAFISGISSIVSGFCSNLPLGIMTSIGPNLLLASLYSSGAFSTAELLAISAASGMVLAILSITPALKWALNLVPLYIKYGLVIGTGLLTALKGLEDVIITKDFTLDLNYVLSLKGAVAAVFLLVIASLQHRKIKGAALVGMLGGTLMYWMISNRWPSSYVSLHFFETAFPDFRALAKPVAWLHVVSVTLTVLLSISGGVIGSARMADLLRNGDAPGSLRVYIVCSFGTILSAFLGTSPVFISMSASSGIREGGRTGLMSIVIGMYSLLTAFVLSPVMSAIPDCALTPVLVLVGAHMFREVKEVDWDNTREALPTFLCAILQPFTGSVGVGIYAGIACSFVLFVTTGAFIAISSSQETRASE